MAMIKKSITITDQQNAWMEAQMVKGHYASDSELIRDLIRERQARMAEVDIIRAKLLEAEQGIEEHGFVDKTPEDMLAGFKAKARRNGNL